MTINRAYNRKSEKEMGKLEIIGALHEFSTIIPEENISSQELEYIKNESIPEDFYNKEKDDPTFTDLSQLNPQNISKETLFYGEKANDEQDYLLNLSERE